MRRLIRRLDIRSWSNWLPLSVIAAFAILGALVALEIVNLTGPLDSAKIKLIYESFGLRVAAGILPTVVTLSLVAIQFASNQYSHRIMTFYIKSVTLWSIIIVYLGLIVFSMLLEANQTDATDPRFAGVVLVGTMMALALLVSHLLITAAFLKPDFIISKLLKRVTTPYLNSIQQPLLKDKGRLDSGADRLLPVVEIVEAAIKRGDLHTTRTAMEEIHKQYLLEAEPLNSPQVEQYFLGYLLRIGRKAVAASDEEEAGVLAVKLIGAVGAVGPAGPTAVEDIRELGFSALKKGVDSVVIQLIESTRDILERTDLPDARSAVLATYQAMIADMATAARRRPLRYLATNLSDIAKASLERQDAETANRCLDMLESVAHNCAIHNLVDVLLHTVQLLQALGVAVAKGDDAATAERIVRSMLRVERSVKTLEREVIAATEFARRDIERIVAGKAVRVPSAVTKDTVPVPEASPVLSENPGSGKDDFSDLWGKSE